MGKENLRHNFFVGVFISGSGFLNTVLHHYRKGKLWCFRGISFSRRLLRYLAFHPTTRTPTVIIICFQNNFVLLGEKTWNFVKETTAKTHFRCEKKNVWLFLAEIKRFAVVPDQVLWSLIRFDLLISVNVRFLIGRNQYSVVMSKNSIFFLRKILRLFTNFTLFMFTF